MKRKMIKNMIRSSVGSGMAVALLAVSALFTSCEKILDIDSELVEFEEDNHLQNSTDSVYSVMGIIYKMQTIADRTVLLGELRGDLTTTTASASADLKALASFDINNQENIYNKVSDYYAVINNCNYFLANINMELEKNGHKVFESEYAVVKAFRAWTYLQLAQIYGEVPLVTEPLLTEEASKNAMNQPRKDIKAICNYFIDDLKPYVDTKLPTYGEINDRNSQKYFIPVRALLGDLCLWAGRYQEAAQFYHDYLALRTDPVRTGVSSVSWSDADTKEFKRIRSSLSYRCTGSECLSYIPMESNEFYGVKSDLYDLYNSTDLNQGYAKLTPTKQYRDLSAAQNYCIQEMNLTTIPSTPKDTTYAPKDELAEKEWAGDLRFGGTYDHQTYAQERFSRTSNERQSIDKFDQDGVTLYRTNMVYLRYAEALNRAGYPQAAFAVLKYGLYPDVVAKQIDSLERAKIGTLVTFDVDLFTIDNTQGIHARGCGDVKCDTLYVLPQPASAKASRQDTVDYQIPRVEDMIVTEMALEGAFEGYRYYDLMRVALRRDSTNYLAEPISKRSGKEDSQLKALLSNRKNWYLPLP